MCKWQNKCFKTSKEYGLKVLKNMVFLFSLFLFLILTPQILPFTWPPAGKTFVYVHILSRPFFKRTIIVW